MTLKQPIYHSIHTPGFIQLGFSIFRSVYVNLFLKSIAIYYLEWIRGRYLTLLATKLAGATYAVYNYMIIE